MAPELPSTAEQFDYPKYEIHHLPDLTEDIDWFIFHQANEFMLKTLIKKLGIPENKAPICLKEYGNTVSSSIPITIKDCQKNDLFKSGDRIMLVSFGVGYSWGSVLLEWVG